jgi:transcriptional regulator GlxA family with amidase domain
MAFSVGIVIYNGFNLMDMAVPYDLLTRANRPDDPTQRMFELFTVSRSKELITCEGGVQILPQHIYPDAQVYDVLLVPGGSGAPEAIKNLRLMNWFGRAAKLAKVVAAIDTGNLILAVSGLLGNHMVAYSSEADGMYPQVRSMGGKEGVRDGKIFTTSSSEFGVALGKSIISELDGRI